LNIIPVLTAPAHTVNNDVESLARKKSSMNR